MRRIRYEFGLPGNPVRAISNSHFDTQLCAKHLNSRAPLIPSKVGLFQYIPLGDQLFIIYDDRAMADYNACIDTNLINPNELKIRNTSTDHTWAEFVLKLKTRNLNDIQHEWATDNTITANNIKQSTLYLLMILK